MSASPALRETANSSTSTATGWFACVTVTAPHKPADKTVEFIVEESRWRLSLVSALSCLVCTHAHRRIYKDLQHNINADGI